MSKKITITCCDERLCLWIQGHQTFESSDAVHCYLHDFHSCETKSIRLPRDFFLCSSALYNDLAEAWTSSTNNIHAKMLRKPGGIKINWNRQKRVEACQHILNVYEKRQIVWILSKSRWFGSESINRSERLLCVFLSAWPLSSVCFVSQCGMSPVDV